tara:strand:+ start:1252 stop:4683 length:3432 start_codon:yes stop_codon:yes gene_type:complete
MASLFDDEERVRRLSARKAALPQWLQMQSEGAENLGDIFSLESDALTSFAERQRKAMTGFKPRYPERLLQSEKPFEWWKEKATLNSMNTVIPMLGFAVGSVMQAIPHPIAKLLGKTINFTTAATTYNANFADTLQEHQELAGRELSRAEKIKAATVAGGVTYLDLLTPVKGARSTSRMIVKTFGNGGLDATRKSLVKLVNTNRQSLIKSAGKGSKYLAGLVGTEMATEAGQKALQIGTSVKPGKLLTSEGMQDMLEEAVVAGPTVGMIGTPSAIGVGAEFNRDLKTGRRLAKNFNANEKARVGMEAIQSGELGKLGNIDEAADLVDIPEGKGFTPPIKLGALALNKKIDDKFGFDALKFGKDSLRTMAFKAPSVVLEARNRQTTGHNYARLNDILQMFIPPGDSSNETKIRNSFQQEKDSVTGEILERTSAIIDQLAKHKWFGLGGRTLDPAINTYLRDRLKGVGPNDQVKSKEKAVAELRQAKPGVTKKEIDTLEAAREVFREDLNRAFELMNSSDTGLSVAYRKNYLHNPVSREEVRKDRQGFIDALFDSTMIEERKRTEKKNSKFYGVRFKPDGTIVSEDPMMEFRWKDFSEKQYQKVEQIARDIIDGRDPTIADSKFLKDLIEKDVDSADREGQGRKDFEKYRSKVWERIPDKFREKDLGSILEQYLQRAGTRVASARTFGGKNADKLTGHLKELMKVSVDPETGKNVSAITKDEAEHIWNMYDASHNVYKKKTTEAGERWRKFSKLGTTVGAITHLGLATFSSLPELLWTGERAGWKNVVKSIPDAWNFARKGAARGINKKNERSEGAKSLARLGFNLNPEVNERLDQLFSTDRSQWLSGYFRSPFGAFLTQWTNFNRNLAVQAGQRMMNDNANNWSKKTSIERNRWTRQLKEQGLTVEDWKQIMQAATDPKTQVVNIDILNNDFLNSRITKTRKTLGKETNEIRIRDVMMPWMHKIVEDVVVQPNPSNKPLWMSNPDFGMIAQLKTFPIVFGNTVVKRLLRKLNPKQCSPDFGMALSVIGTVAGAYAVAYVAEQMKSSIKRSDPRDLGIISGANVIGLTGAFSLLGGAQYGDLSTSIMGPSLDAVINKGFGDFFGPMLDDADFGKGVDNLMGTLSDGVLGSLGPIGLNIKGLMEDEE